MGYPPEAGGQVAKSRYSHGHRELIGHNQRCGNSSQEVRPVNPWFEKVIIFAGQAESAGLRKRRCLQCFVAMLRLN